MNSQIPNVLICFFVTEYGLKVTEIFERERERETPIFHRLTAALTRTVARYGLQFGTTNEQTCLVPVGVSHPELDQDRQGAATGSIQDPCSVLVTTANYCFKNK